MEIPYPVRPRLFCLHGSHIGYRGRDGIVIQTSYLIFKQQCILFLSNLELDLDLDLNLYRSRYLDLSRSRSNLDLDLDLDLDLA